MIAITAITSGGFGMLGVKVGLAVMQERVQNLKEQLDNCIRDFKNDLRDVWNEIRTIQEVHRDLETEVDRLKIRFIKEEPKL